MQRDKTTCHGQFDGLVPCSESLNLSITQKLYWKLKKTAFNTLWHLKTKGLIKTLRLAFYKARNLTGLVQKDKQRLTKIKDRPVYDEVLNLKSGELVDVKSEEEILATLDEGKKNKGLYWMASMRKFCGKRFRVYKRLERILLESTGEYREVKNTVLLEGVVCNGQEFHGCDRSCFHFWREAWLKRVNE